MQYNYYYGAIVVTPFFSPTRTFHPFMYYFLPFVLQTRGFL